VEGEWEGRGMGRAELGDRRVGELELAKSVEHLCLLSD
jgi:hypothetical protein